MTRRGFSLVEAVLASLVVAVALTGALEAAAAARVGRQKLAQRSEGLMLAQDLMSEILVLDFADPSGVTGNIGPGPGETDRAHFNDIDDYNALVDDPPTDRAGNKIECANGLVRTVSVGWVSVSKLQASTSETQAKRIDVVVTSGAREVAHLTAFRTSGTKVGSVKIVPIIEGATPVVIQ